MTAGNTTDPFTDLTIWYENKAYHFGPNERKTLPDGIGANVDALSGRVRTATSADQDKAGSSGAA